MLSEMTKLTYCIKSNLKLNYYEINNTINYYIVAYE